MKIGFGVIKVKVTVRVTVSLELLILLQLNVCSGGTLLLAGMSS